MFLVFFRELLEVAEKCNPVIGGFFLAQKGVQLLFENLVGQFGFVVLAAQCNLGGFGFDPVELGIDLAIFGKLPVRLGPLLLFVPKSRRDYSTGGAALWRR
ncbi:MAG: hypothetical protein ABIQ93_17070 [Saprospiraceae bacterium]